MDTTLSLYDFVVLDASNPQANEWYLTLNGVYRVLKIRESKYRPPLISIADLKSFKNSQRLFTATSKPETVEVPSELFRRATPEEVDKYLERLTPKPKEPPMAANKPEHSPSDFEVSIDDLIHKLDLSYSSGLAIRFIVAADCHQDSKTDRLYALRTAREALDREINKARQ